jgi:hypothetical protein
MVDGTTPLNAANLNLFLTTTKIEVKIIYAHIRYNGASWEVDSGVDSAEIVSGDISFNGTSDSVEIVVAGFTNIPLAIPSPGLVNSAFYTKAEGQTTTRVDVRFYNIDTGAHITAAPTTDMDFNIIIIGF